jgi:YaiO family outer membrane protein
MARRTYAAVGFLFCAALAPAAAAEARIDVSASRSSLSNGLEPWREVSAALSLHRGDYTWGVLVEDSKRFGLSDLYVEARLEQRRDWGDVSVTFGGASDADFRPEAMLKTGLRFDVSSRMTWEIDVSAAQYVDADIYTAQAGFEREFGYRHASLAGRVIVSGNEQVSAGYALRGEIDLCPRLRGRIGYARAPEFSEGAVVEVEAWSAAGIAEVRDNIVLRAEYVHEDRGFYERDVFSVGAGVRLP